MTDLMFPGKRPRAPSLLECHVPIGGGSNSSPDQELPQAEMKNFLEICRFCKKNLPQGEDIYMYGYFGAFCTKQCRAKQMAVDIFMEKSQEKAVAVKKVRISSVTRSKGTKDASLDKSDKVEAPRFYIS